MGCLKRAVSYAGNSFKLAGGEHLFITCRVQRIDIEQLAVLADVEADMRVLRCRTARLRRLDVERRKSWETIAGFRSRHPESDKFSFPRVRVQLHLRLRQRLARIRNQEDRRTRRLQCHQILRLADKRRLIDIESWKRRHPALRLRKLMNLSQLLTAVMLVERHLQILSLQALVAREQLVNREQKCTSVIAGDVSTHRMCHRILVLQFAPFREEGRIPRGHDGDPARSPLRFYPEAASERIIMHGLGADACDACPGIHHIGMAIVDTRTTGTVLYSEDCDNYVAKIRQTLTDKAIEVIFYRVHFHKSGKICIGASPNRCRIHIRACQRMIQKTPCRFARFNRLVSGG